MSESLDRAQWKRYTNRGGRCLVCGSRAEVNIVISALEVTGGRGGSNLTKETVSYCNTHALDRYGMALRVLQTGVSRGEK